MRADTWAVRVEAGRLIVNGMDVGDVIDWDDQRYTQGTTLPRAEAVRRAFEAGRRVEGAPPARKPVVFEVVGEVC